MSIDLYVKPQYRKEDVTKSLLSNVNTHLTEKVKNIQFVMRTDPNAPDHTERQSLEQFHLSKNAKPVYVVRRSASNIDEYNKNEIFEKANFWHKTIEEKGYSFILVKNGNFQEQDKFKIEDFILLVQRIRNDMPKEDR